MDRKLEDVHAVHTRNVRQQNQLVCFEKGEYRLKYRFVTIMHNMKLETIKKRGIKIFPGGRISNGTQILTETMETNLKRSTAGVHSIDEFNSTVYFYIDSEFKDIHSIDEMDMVGTKYTFFFLRVIQSFVHCLWKIKDNNIYIRDGFLIVYEKKIDDGYTYKASLSEIFSRSTLERNETLFLDGELQQAIDKYKVLDIAKSQIDKVDYKNPTDDIFLKNIRSDRMIRSIYFTVSARKSSIYPMKIVFYCTALECLFSTSTSEITHKIAERVALSIGNSVEDKKRLFKLIKKAYSTRSSIVHGASLSGVSADLKEMSYNLDNILRELISSENEIFSKKDNELEEIFVNLLFED